MTGRNTQRINGEGSISHSKDIIDDERGKTKTTSHTNEQGYIQSTGLINTSMIYYIVNKIFVCS